MTRIKKNTRAKKTQLKTTARKQKVNKGKTAKQLRNTKRQPKSSLRNPAKRRFYTIKEDAQILQKLQNMKDTTKGKVLNELAEELNRTHESLRDRIKRYLGRLSSNGKKEVLKQAKQNKDLYLHLAPVKGAYREIRSIDEHEPSVLNIEKYNKQQKRR